MVNWIPALCSMSLFLCVFFHSSVVEGVYTAYRYDFEQDPKFEEWTSDGLYITHSFELIESGEAGRGKVLHVDIELLTANYVYFQIPQKIPLNGNYKMSADVRVETAANANIAFGANIAVSPVKRAGIYTLTALEEPSNWKTQAADIGLASREKAAKIIDSHFFGITIENVGVWLDKVGLFVKGEPGGRVSFDIDRVVLEGNAPEASLYEKQREAAWHEANLKIRKELNSFSIPVLRLSGHDDNGTLTALDKLRAATDHVFKTTEVNGYVEPQEVRKLRYYAKSIKHMKTPSGRVLRTIPWEPTSPLLILPTTDPIPAEEGNEISIQACRDEYEPASFILRSSVKLTDVIINVSDLISSSGETIPREAVDIRLVKCWFQAGSDDLVQRNEKTLVPELLVKDSELVLVDLQAQTNSLRGTLNGTTQYFDITRAGSKLPENIVIDDAEHIRPFDLQADFNQQVWLTVRVPPNASEGVYNGTVGINAKEISSTEMQLKVEVLPFDLPEPDLEYSIYYRGKLSTDKEAPIGSEYKTEEQYRRELADLKAHGVKSPTIYQAIGRNLNTELAIRNELGLSKKRLFTLGLQTKGPYTTDGLNQLADKVKAWKSIADSNGYNDLFVYGIDEAKDDLITEQLPAWQTVLTNGAYIFVACPHHADIISENKIALGVLNGPLNSDVAKRWTDSNLQVFSYGNPQIGVENPDTYRTNYGFRLWHAGYSGAMSYAYQHSFDDIWNDFDHEKYRDHVFAYPTSNGLIETIQYEGFREAVDDVRYLTAAMSASNLGKAQWREVLEELIASSDSAATIRHKIISIALNPSAQAPVR